MMTKPKIARRFTYEEEDTCMSYEEEDTRVYSSE